MATPYTAIKHFSLFMPCTLLVLALVAACGTATGSTSTSTNHPATPTASGFPNRFQGEGFAIRYPTGWTKESDQAGDSVYFRESSNPYYWFAVRVEVVGTDPLDTDAVSTAMNDVLYELGHGSQCKQATSLAPSISINGTRWTQVEAVCAVVGTSTSPPVLTIHVLVTTQSQKYFIVDEVAPPTVFDQLSRTIFQPMLQSFTLGVQ